MAEEYLRQTIRMAEASVLQKGIGTTLSDLGYVFGLSGFALASGKDYVPYDGYPASLHEGEMVLQRPEAEAYRNGGAGGNVFDFSGQVLHVGDGVSRSEFASALQANNRQQESRIRRLLATGTIG